MPDTLGPVAFDVALAWLAGLGAIAAVGVVWVAWIVPRRVKARLRTLADLRDALYDTRSRPDSRPMRSHAVELAARVVERLDLLRSAQASRFHEKLQQTGWRRPEAMVIFLFAKFALPLVAGAATVVGLYVLPVFDLPDLAKAALAVVLVFVAFVVPDVVVTNTIARRRDQIAKAMPDALDLLVICAESGLHLDAALDYVSRETRRHVPELADEIRLTSVELGMLPDRRQALRNLAQRVPVPDMRNLTNMLIQTERYGTPLSEAVRVLAAEMRTNRMTRAEEKAARLPAVLTVPMILFIMPALFIVLIGPGALSIIDVFRKL